jgi:phage/plasmid-like protein (TIGR03299 family)
VAHRLSIKNGNAEMMSVETVPWHGLGTVLTKAPKTAAEAIEAAGLAWKVGLKSIFCADDKHFFEYPERKAIVRLDRWGEEGFAPFAWVGNDYEVLQNTDAFKFFDPIVQTGKVRFETAGALGNGERVWVLARVEGGEKEIAADDRIDRYLLLSTGHDGRTAVQIRFTPVRVVCQNTLTMAMENADEDFAKAYHVPGLQASLKDAQEDVSRLLTAFDEKEATFRRMVAKKLDETLFQTYVEEVFPYPKRKHGQGNDSYTKSCLAIDSTRMRADWYSREGRGNGTPEVKESVWAAYNGVTELVDHRMTYRDPWHRLESCWFGDAFRVKQRAFDAACKLVEL